MYPLYETCRALTDLLVAVTDKAVAAAARLAGLAGARQQASFNAAEIEAGVLREEYQRIKAELDRHRVEHHTTEKSKAVGTSGKSISTLRPQLPSFGHESLLVIYYFPERDVALVNSACEQHSAHTRMRRILVEFE